ncbi:MAG: hypothetical protein L0Y57_01690 [Beijerinckiaceae bacterium]|nr:hypothetical protein [Beijerinckiaceae bacterium]
MFSVDIHHIRVYESQREVQKNTSADQDGSHCLRRQRVDATAISTQLREKASPVTPPASMLCGFHFDCRGTGIAHVISSIQTINIRKWYLILRNDAKPDHSNRRRASGSRGDQGFGKAVRHGAHAVRPFRNTATIDMLEGGASCAAGPGGDTRIMPDHSGRQSPSKVASRQDHPLVAAALPLAGIKPGCRTPGKPDPTTGGRPPAGILRRHSRPPLRRLGPDIDRS